MTLHHVSIRTDNIHRLSLSTTVVIILRLA